MWGSNAISVHSGCRSRYRADVSTASSAVGGDFHGWHTHEQMKCTAPQTWAWAGRPYRPITLYAQWLPMVQPLTNKEGEGRATRCDSFLTHVHCQGVPTF